MAIAFPLVIAIVIRCKTKPFNKESIMEIYLKQLFTPCVLFIAGATLSSLWHTYSSDDAVKSAVIENAVPIDVGNNSAPPEVSALQIEIKRLQQQLTQVNRTLNANQPATLIDHKPTTNGNKPQQNLAAELIQLRTFKAETRNQQFIDWALKQQVQGNDPLIEMAAAFENDMHTGPEAVVKAEQLTRIFHENEYLAAFNIEQSECKTSQCLVAISTSDATEVEQLMQAVTPAFKNSPIFSKQSVLILRDSENSRSYVYISENEQNLVF